MTDLMLQDGETLAGFVTRGIRLVFDRLAEELGDTEMTEDQAAGVPFQLFTKCEVLVAAWKKIAEEESDAEQ